MPHRFPELTMIIARRTLPSLPWAEFGMFGLLALLLATA